MYKLVIFDLDGTLLDSLDDITFYLNNTLQQFGIAPVTRAQATAYIGNGAKELVRLAIGENNAHRLNEILAAYKKAYAASENKLAKLYPGEEKALRTLKDNGVKLAVLTNKPHAAAVKSQSIFFKQFSFDCFQGQEDGLPLKPAPDGVNKIIEKLGVKREECLFVGDGETDVQTAKNAKIDGVCVTWGYRTYDQLKAAGGKNFVESFEKLCGLVLCCK